MCVRRRASLAFALFVLLACSALRAEDEDAKAAAAELLLANAQGAAEEAESVRLLQRALASYQELGSREGVARVLHALATVHVAAGRLDEARDLEGRALELYDQLGDAGAGRLEALLGLGSIHRLSGEYTTALATLEEALRHAQRLGTVRGAATAGLEIGVTRAAVGEAEAARSEIEGALRMFREMALVDGIARARLALAGLVDTSPADAAAHARAALADLPPLERGDGWLARARARALRTELGRVGFAAAMQTRDLDAALHFADYVEARSLLADLAARDALRAALLPQELRTEFERARRALSDAEAAYAAAVEAGGLARVRERRRLLEAARDRLVSVAVRLEQARRQVVDPVAPAPASLAKLQSALPDDATLLLYAGLAGRTPQVLVISSAGARAVQLESVGSWPELGADWDAPGVERIRRILAEPVVLPESVRRLLVVPDGPLAFVPPVLLFPEHDVSYVPSASAWLLLREPVGPAGEQVLAIGDCRPDASSLPPLPSTREEAQAVGDVRLLGDEATKVRLLELLAREERWRALHFAGHGRMDPDRPLISALLLTPTVEDDGLLTVLDVLRLRVRADLVVLSSPDSARGKLLPGEGVVGFPRAFLFAGAPRVVGTLWCPDDEAAAALMIRFHELWGSGVGAAAALRRAQAHVRAQERWAHPRFWAGWVLWGLGQ